MRRSKNPRQNVRLALHWWSWAARKGLPVAATNAGVALESGVAGRKSVTAAARLYTQAAQAGDYLARFNLARLYALKLITAKRAAASSLFADVLPELRRLSRSQPKARQCLGQCYYHGWSVRKSTRRAFLHFLKAARQGDTSAMLSVALCYRDGEGTLQNRREYANWRKRAKRDPVNFAIQSLQTPSFMPLRRMHTMRRAL